MVALRIETDVAASKSICFDLARSVDAHLASAAQTNERAVGGKTSGLMQLGDEVTWRARHLGVVQEFTSRITEFDRPNYFRDEMQRGAFRYFVHDHHFETAERSTRIIDIVEFAAPLGWLGGLAERLILRQHMSRFLSARAAALKQLAESDAWKGFLSPTG